MLVPLPRRAQQQDEQSHVNRHRQSKDAHSKSRDRVDKVIRDPSPEEFIAVYEQAGFKDIDARLIERPTPLDHGVAAWVTTFRAGWLDRAGVPQEERQSIAEAVADRVGINVADYVRLRFIMRKPN